ncbi:MULTISPECIES: isoprenyl transferase [Gimesia]|uniref:Isoprenyl transferase n=2 Tax=Gimesia TaxID=1649453 RepID=A0A6I6AEV5_9PLAN|nr:MULTISPECIES: isoprenyl transferase [Gimesia]MBN71197.1 di-trans,poly-cis-decaprenylcistransferase [Gimesia sp.]QDT86937.1 Decaprenyl diphosphate synthase-like protein [Gimesia chilikensis]QDU04997.1 Decaprenyl diphosphate synthase-like protein [Gimesia chilikensis]QGQ25144.1 isoprenyl transferase [Gimesia benthica]
MPAISEQDGESLGLESRQLPRHIAIIMDGNGRWASRRGFPRIEGHRQGVNSVRTVVEESTRLGIEQLTLYCLSSENWKRPALELNLLMQLLKKFVIGEREEIMRQNIRFSTIGRRSDLPKDVLAEVDKTIDESRNNTGMQLCLALNYGSRSEIVDAVKSIVSEVEQGGLKAEDIDEDVISSHLYTAGMPDPDLVIRTAGEMRVSNFLLWQISYAELWVTETYWPDFSVNDFWQALRDFAARDRRFGGLKG